MSDTNESSTRFYLDKCYERVALFDSHHPKAKPFYIDLLSKERRNILRTARRSDPLFRATAEAGKVIDASAGWLKDATLLLSLGVEVHAIERNPIVFELIQDALKWAIREEEFAEVFHRLNLTFGTSEDLARKMCEPNDVIYYDPMFVQPKKTALSSKGMQILQELEAPSAEQNLESAKLLSEIKKKSLVIKRPLKASPLLPEPQHSSSGKLIRYDIYK